MHLHIFTDRLGIYMKQFAFQMESYFEECVYINFYDSIPEGNKFHTVNESESSLISFVGQLEKVEKVFFHPLNSYHQEVLFYLKKKFPEIISYWIIWSKEIHVNPISEWLLYEPFSKAFMKDQYGHSNPIISYLKYSVNRLLELLRLKENQFAIFLNVTQKIDYVCCLFEEEFEDVQEYIGLQHDYIRFSYNNTSSFNNLDSNKTFEKKYIMVNHCADPLMNHYEVLGNLNEIKVKDPILLPLSYGNEKYKAILLEKIDSFDLDLTKLDNKLSEEEYGKLLMQVKVAFFNVKIQQGLANIFNLIWLGAKVFIHEKSPVYRGLKGNGLYVFSCQSLNSMSQLTGLSLREQEHNRELLISLVGKEASSLQFKNLLDN